MCGFKNSKRLLKRISINIIIFIGQFFGSVVLYSVDMCELAGLLHNKLKLHNCFVYFDKNNLKSTKYNH